MSEPKTRKRIYRVWGLIALLYTIAGTLIFWTTNVDYFGPASEYKYDIRNDPVMLGIIVLITGVPLFLLFVFLERRAK